MAKNTANVTVNVINKAQSTSPPPLGIAYVMGPTERGIPNDASTLISSIGQFEKYYGGLTLHDFPLECHQALQGGASLRVCKVAGAGAAPSVSSEAEAGAGKGCFILKSKGVGTYYNSPTGSSGVDFMAEIALPSNGKAAEGYFDLFIWDLDAQITEIYENLLVIPGTVAESTYLKDIKSSSRLVTVDDYLDTSGFTAGAPMTIGQLIFSGGNDGASPLTIANYKGDKAKSTGIYAFDAFDDGNTLAALSHGLDTLQMYGVCNTYATVRKDLVYIDHLDNSKSDQSSIVTELLTIIPASKFAMILVGGVKVNDILNGGIKEMQGTGMVLGTIATSQNLWGPWYSPTAFSRGSLIGPIGVVNNFGTPSDYMERNQIARHGGNCIVNKSQAIMLWDAYTMALGNSPEKFFSVVQLEIYMVDVLRPMLEQFLGDPNTFTTWERIYYTALPFLDSLVENQALYSYKWDGDQFATSLEELNINDATEVGQGIYRIQLQVKVVVPIVEIFLNIILTENSVEFS